MTGRGLSPVVGFVTLVLTTLACPAQSVGDQQTSVKNSKSVVTLPQKLAAAQQQLALLDERITRLSADDAARLTSFVVGNLYFVLVHELGHAVISQLQLPVLGREEDAADSFATLSMMSIGTELSHTVIGEAARGLWLMTQRDKSANNTPAAYDEHSLDIPRAYQILCLMVGSDPKKFGDLAAIAKIPEDRQKTCGYDYAQAASSWETLLNGRSTTAKSRFFAKTRSARKGAADIRVSYDEPNGGTNYRNMLKAGSVLETVARFGRDKLALPRPITIKAKTCEEPNAYWDEDRREVVICYELVGEFVDLELRAQSN